MKERLLDLVVCPGCKGSLEPEAVERQGEEIREGTLHCRSCRAVYPIRGHIPRFVDVDRYLKSFSMEWNVFRSVQIDILNKRSESEDSFVAKTGFDEKSVKGKLFLDAGVGAGRYAEVVSRWGGEVVGFDLSYAVDAAWKNIGSRENVHLVQADIFQPPFREEAFESMYSIGVLHHTPDTHKAFRSLVPLLGKGGSFAIFVYGKSSFQRYSNIWRKLTTKLPLRLMLALCTVAIPLYYLYRIPLLGVLVQPLAPISMHSHWKERWLDTFDWYTPTYQWKHQYPEVYRWFVESGFTDIEIFDYPICMRGTRV